MASPKRPEADDSSTADMEGYSVQPNSGLSSGGVDEMGPATKKDAVDADKNGQRQQAEYHFGKTNPFGPIDSSGRTSKSISTEEETGNGQLTHTTVYTTVIPDGSAFRTTRVLVASQKSGIMQKQKQKFQLQSTMWEKSVPLGDTDRVIQTPVYDRNRCLYYNQSTERIRPGGSTTVRRQMFNPNGIPAGPEDVVEYPPTEIIPKRGWNNPFANAPSGASGTASREEMTVVSELTTPRISRPIDVDEDNTFGGLQSRFDDPTLDPTFIDYNAGFSEEMAQKHRAEGIEGAATPPILHLSQSASTEKDTSNSRGYGSSSQRNGKLYAGVQNTKNLEGEGRKQKGLSRLNTKSKVVILVAALLCVAIAVGIAVGMITSRGNTAQTNNNGALSSPTLRPTNAIPSGEAPSIPSPALSEIFAKTGFERYWASDDGWVVAPSFATFTSGHNGSTTTIGDAFQSSSSYYDAYYLSDLALCADRCDKTDAVGGAYFDLSEENKRSVCLCYKAAECYDKNLVFSGGTVFLREEHFVQPAQTCQMSTCAYFPQDPICDGLDIVDVETWADLQLQPVIGKLGGNDIMIFEQECSEFLNNEFIQLASPVEGIRCKFLGQELTNDRRRTRIRILQAEDEAIILNLRLTGFFLRSSNFPDAASVKFDDRVKRALTNNGADLVQRLVSNELDGNDYFRNVVFANIVDSMSSRAPTNQPSPYPTEEVTQPKVIFTTDEPSPSPTDDPTESPTQDTIVFNTPDPTSQPTLRRQSSSKRYCLGSYCWVELSLLTSQFYGDSYGDEVGFDSSGTRISVSASRSSESGLSEAGVVKVYDIEENNLVQVGQSLHGFQEGDECKGYLSPDGRRLVMSSHKRNSLTGRVWIFELQESGQWAEQGRITGQNEGERFGNAVSLNDDVIAISAPFAYDKRGCVRIYRKRSGFWRQMSEDLIGTYEDEKFGWDVALAANADTLTLVVGQKSDDNDENDGRSGEVRIFQWNGPNINANGSFEQVGNAIKGARAGDDFGRAVAISDNGETIAAGARFFDSRNGVNSGHIRVFNNSGGFGGSWLRTPFDGSEIIGDQGQDNMMNVAMNKLGTRVAAGAASATNEVGYIKVYEKASFGWRQIGDRLNGSEAGGKFGSDIALSSDGLRLLVGSPARDNDEIRGSIVLFELQPAN